MSLRFKLPLLLTTALLLFGCSQSPPQLAQIIARGELNALTLNNPTSYYLTHDNLAAGFEVDLLRQFSQQLGVKLHLTVVESPAELYEALRESSFDIAAAGLTIDRGALWLRYSPPYTKVKQLLIGHQKDKLPKSLAELPDYPHPLTIISGTRADTLLQTLLFQYRDLTWQTLSLTPEALLEEIWQQRQGVTIVDDHTFNLYRRFYPELKSAFELTESESVAWAMRAIEGDETLYQATADFIETISHNGQLAILADRHFGHFDEYSFVGSRTFRNHVESRLSRFRVLFEYAGKEVDLDWRILAAMAYQESHWDPDAVSPTGVKGIMMLTLAASKDIGVEDRTDPVQSIRGGALYLRRLIDRIPADITMPDRIWFAMAAYNIGLGHLEDARILTQRQGDNPDLWQHVRNHLPKLRQKKWHSTVKHGYARGDEAANYVERIRGYYDILRWQTEKEAKEQQQLESQPQPLHLMSDNPVL
ncbi:membrane-bound lytic murein transglycosylase MltF [Ectothiorhodospiraceae bacterium BW-2]|nr:membrane-bound lytic murein transglycosylase MltF [Ectothiorhodospiraceae bacterium BW-2]